MGIFSSGTFDSAQKWPKSLQKRGKFACRLHNRQLWARLEAFWAFYKILTVITYYLRADRAIFPLILSGDRRASLSINNQTNQK